MRKKKNTALQQAKNECKFRAVAYTMIFFLIIATLFGQTERIHFNPRSSQRHGQVFINLIQNFCQALTNNIQAICISTVFDKNRCRIGQDRWEDNDESKS